TQLKAWKTSGMVRLRRPPKMMALTGTPSRSLAAGSRAGLLVIGAVKRLLGCAALRPTAPGVQGWPIQSVHCAGGSEVLPSHQTSPSGSSATLVKIVSRDIECIALGLVSELVPGTTPK